jgi:hypothetical protein
MPPTVNSRATYALAAGEQAQRHDRLLRAQLDEHEPGQQRHGRGEGGERGAIRPAVRTGPHEAVDESGHAERRAHRAENVEAARVALGLRQVARGQQHQRDADRHVDEQSPAPRGQVGQQAADHQADAGASARGGGVEGDRAHPLASALEAHHQQGQGGRGGDGRGQALDGAGGQQPGAVGGQTTEQRGEGE